MLSLNQLPKPYQYYYLEYFLKNKINLKGNIILDANSILYYSPFMITKDLLDNIHPGEILLEEFLKPLDISQYQLGKDSEIPHSSITRIIQGEQAITPEVAIKLANYFDTSEKFWLGLQADYDIEELKRKKTFLFSKNRKRAIIKKLPKNHKLVIQ
jgi:addiction module HigA family antidote